jgi:hypothetical protein
MERRTSIVIAFMKIEAVTAQDGKDHTLPDDFLSISRCLYLPRRDWPLEYLPLERTSFQGMQIDIHCLSLLSILRI